MKTRGASDKLQQKDKAKGEVLSTTNPVERTGVSKTYYMVGRDRPSFLSPTKAIKEAIDASQQNWEDAQPAEVEEEKIVEIVDGSRQMEGITDGGSSQLTLSATKCVPEEGGT